MRKKGGNILEEHVEKIVLALIGLVCVWLLITRVVISPNKVVLYAGVKLGPGDIDRRISQEAEFLKLKLASKPEPLPPYKQRVDAFIGMVDLPIGDIDISLYWPLPFHSSTVIDKQKYGVPLVGEVTDAAISYIRAVVYEPIIEIDGENQYDMAVSRPNDIDFVTVEAKFDVLGLRGRFYDSFAGDDVEQEEWRDPCLAEPVFAAVQLQRQELGADGSWGQWQVVPRTRIDLHKKMFESVEGIEYLPPGGIKVRLLQFDDAEVRRALLQPAAYMIASAKEEWFPPSLHKKYLEQRQEIEREKDRRAKETEILEREQEREKARKEREEAREDRRGRTSDTGSSRGQTVGRRDSTRREDRLGTGRERSRRDRGDRGDGTGTEVLSRREEREERERERKARLEELRETSRATSLEDIYKELDEILITKKTNLTRLREPLLFWAHDDTVEPGNSYRYRIRLGVFSPIAGTNKFKGQYENLKNKIVLWSEFSEVKEIVKVPETLYFFPSSVQEAARVVTVNVAKYTLGYWYSKDFSVKPGEVIGKVAEFEPAEGEKIVLTTPETIDYTTGVVLVDVVPVNDWSGGKNMYARRFYDMLYSFDGDNIEHIPVSTRYWEEERRIKLNEITRSQKEPKEPLRPWDTKLNDWELAPELGYRYDDDMGSIDKRTRIPRRSR